MTLLFDLLVIAFLLSVAGYCFSWGIGAWGLASRGWYASRWRVVQVRLLAIWAFLIGLYNLVFGLMKVWFTIEGYLV